MKIINEKIYLNTKGNPDFINITDDISRILGRANLKRGSVTVFVIGSTAAITTFEYEPGLLEDMKDIYEKLIPFRKGYQTTLPGAMPTAPAICAPHFRGLL